MNNLKSFSNFTLENLNESNMDFIIKKKGISEEELGAMRENPEDKGKMEKYEKYYIGDKAADFVETIIDIVAEVFGDDDNIKTFMKRLSAVESCYGTNPKTYSRPGETKGIFQLDKKSSLKTIGYMGQKPQGNWIIRKNLEKARAKIKKELGLNWDMVPYESLAKPLYNALACRMFLEVRMKDYKYDQKTNKTTTIDKPIPSDLNGQAKWWKDRYNTSSGAGTESKFKNPPGCSL
jgi:hypothetical protein